MAGEMGKVNRNDPGGMPCDNIGLILLEMVVVDPTDMILDPHDRSDKSETGNKGIVTQN